MIIGYQSTIAAFRDRTAASSAPIVLRRKKCECGKVVTAKQLAQYGQCAPCAARAAIGKAAA